MKKAVLITGAGGAAIPDIVKRLKEEGFFRVILADMQPLDGRALFADRFYRVPPANDDGYLQVIRRIVEQEKLDAIVPCVDEELLRFVEFRKETVCPKVVMPSSEFVLLTLDKLKTQRALSSCGIAVPQTYPISAFSEIPCDFLEHPLVVKPIRGRGSRGLFYLSTRAETEALMGYLKIKQPNSIFQEWIMGTEYTVSVVVSCKGELLGIIPKRVLVKRGITLEGVTERNSLVIDCCRQIAERLNPRGPFNVQLVVNDKNHPFVFEINPRFSTTTILTSESGFPEITISLLDFLGECHQIPEWEEGVRLVRKWSNCFDRPVSSGTS